jgi:hypothetical protein
LTDRRFLHILRLGSHVRILSLVCQPLGYLAPFLYTILVIPPEIRLYDAIPYFAYHKVDHQVIIGFYFSAALGQETGAYEVLDQDTKNFFAGHFDTIFFRARSSILLDVSSGHNMAALNRQLVDDIKKSMLVYFNPEPMSKLLCGETITAHK